MRIRNVLLVCLVIVIANIGLVYAFAKTFNSPHDEGYIRLDINENNPNRYHPDFKPNDSTEAFETSRTLVENWADEHDAKIFYKSFEPFELASCYYLPNTDKSEVIYTSNARASQMLLKDNVIDRVEEVPEIFIDELRSMEVFENNLFFPFSNLKTFSGLLYIEDKSDTVLDLYENLQEHSMELWIEKDDVLPKSMIGSLLGLAQKDSLEDKAILLSVIVIVTVAIYTVYLIVTSMNYEISVRRLFGLSIRLLVGRLSVFLLLVLLLTTLINILVTYLFLLSTSMHYIFQANVFLLALNFLLLIIIFLLQIQIIWRKSK